jgi:hypothetical protein
VQTESHHDEEALEAQLNESQARLDGLVRELQVIDGEIDELSVERHQYDLLQDVCGSLEKLSELGGSELFWGDRPSDGNGEHHVGMVRRRVEEFQQRFGEIEKARQALLDRISGEQGITDYLEDDVFEAKRREELRKLEWLIERDMTPPSSREIVMPWSRGGDDDRLFRKYLAASLLLSLLLGILAALIDLPIPDRWGVVEIPERLTRLIEERTPTPPPPVQELARAEEKEPETTEEEPKLAEESTPEPTAEPKPRQSAGSKGILAFREKFSGLADSKPSAKLGAQARISRSGESAIGQQGRALVATLATSTSGGINVAAISRDAVSGGGGSLEGVDVGRATSSIGAIGGPERPLSSGPGLSRTDEEIQIVFDRHKAALYRLYNRELRRDPTLRGQIVLRMTIEPDGSVSLCEVKSSDMEAPKLAAQVAGRVKGFDFGAKDGVSAITIIYPIDFLPAT